MSKFGTLDKIVDEVLHYIWDPIGVKYEPYARDEYYMYHYEILQALKNNATQEEIAKILSDITRIEWDYLSDVIMILL